MNFRIPKWMGLLSLAVLLSLSVRAQAPGERYEPAPNLESLSANAKGVVDMQRSGVAESVILTYVESAPGRFDLTANQVVQLKRAFLTPSVVSAMIKHDQHVKTASQPSVGAPTSSPPAPAMAKTTKTRRYADPIADPSPPLPKKKVRKIVVEQQPPPPKPEIVPLPPGQDYYWTPGYWTWRGGEWRWQKGRWIHDPGHGAKWVGGHWAKNGRGYIWVDGYWLY